MSWRWPSAVNPSGTIYPLPSSVSKNWDTKVQKGIAINITSDKTEFRG